MPKTFLEKLLRKPVIVRSGGLEYRGLLLEVSEKDVTIRRETSIMTIPMERVTSIVDPNEPHPPKDKKFIDPSFYTADETPDETPEKKS